MAGRGPLPARQHTIAGTGEINCFAFHYEKALDASVGDRLRL
jgi:hypothetical protein